MRKFLQAESGQGMVEYGLILALIALVVVVAFPPIGRMVSSMLDRASNALDSSVGG